MVTFELISQILDALFSRPFSSASSLKYLFCEFPFFASIQCRFRICRSTENWKCRTLTQWTWTIERWMPLIFWIEINCKQFSEDLVRGAYACTPFFMPPSETVKSAIWLHPRPQQQQSGDSRIKNFTRVEFLPIFIWCYSPFLSRVSLQVRLKDVNKLIQWKFYDEKSISIVLLPRSVRDRNVDEMNSSTRYTHKNMNI